MRTKKSSVKATSKKMKLKTFSPATENIRLDNLLFNEGADEDDESNVHEQRLKRAKEYIEQIAKQGWKRRMSCN